MCLCCSLPAVARRTERVNNHNQQRTGRGWLLPTQGVQQDRVAPQLSGMEPESGVCAVGGTPAVAGSILFARLDHHAALGFDPLGLAVQTRRRNGVVNDLAFERVHRCQTNRFARLVDVVDGLLGQEL